MPSQADTHVAQPAEQFALVDAQIGIDPLPRQRAEFGYSAVNVGEAFHPVELCVVLVQHPTTFRQMVLAHQPGQLQFRRRDGLVVIDAINRRRYEFFGTDSKSAM